MCIIYPKTATMSSISQRMEDMSMVRLMHDDLFTAQLLRTIGYAPYGGADIGECLAVAARISKVDLALWHSEWSALASATHERAEESAARGDTVSARDAYFRASNYFRTSGIFAMGAPISPILKEAHRLEVESFRRGAALIAMAPQLIRIPYESTALPGYFFAAKADGEKRPPLILVT